MEIIIKNVRLAFFNGYEPGTFEGKQSFGAQLIIAPNHPQIADIDKAIQAVAKEKWKDSWKEIYQMLDKQGRLCFRKGPKLDKQGKPYDGFEGMFHLSCSAAPEKRPLCLKANKTVSTSRDGDLYGGCYADVKLSLWPQDNQWGRRVNAQPLVFQKRADGDAFAGGPPPTPDGMDDLSDVGGELDSLVG